MGGASEQGAGEAGGEAWLAEPAALDAWLDGAKPGDEFTYAQAVMLPKCAIGTYAMALYEDGEIELKQRRNGSGIHYIAQRRARGDRPVSRHRRPRSIAPELGGEAERLMAVLRWLADNRRICMSNAQLAAMAQLRDRDQAKYQLERLVKAGLILVERFPGANPAEDRRVVTIVASGRRTKLAPAGRGA